MKTVCKRGQTPCPPHVAAWQHRAPTKRCIDFDFHGCRPRCERASRHASITVAELSRVRAKIVSGYMPMANGRGARGSRRSSPIDCQPRRRCHKIVVRSATASGAE
ncbi:hypothetical protein MYA_4194 [Burkholderia sp. KJ006]|nr:hypothetical protein MYA_4194 [Burkholderia sp. KJ006]